ncbi:MAG: VIT1/CCC1 transporter family protein [Candidatus Yanofskybacteria bacterium]|nr:VIT1/CCC1 transporter family protein [Candidatus Yanofskybacteria bacterium]
MWYRNIPVSYVRSFAFGVEDSLVSTVGLLSGIAIVGMGSAAIFITGMVLIFVEAFSMAVGSFLSEHLAEDYAKQAEMPLRHSLFSGVVMFLSYFISGFIPLFPYAVMPVASALWTSILLSLAALFLLGVIGAKMSHIGIIRNSLRTLTIGGIAIIIGVIVGRTISVLI